MGGKRGRPAIPPKEPIFVRVDKTLYDDLQFLTGVLDGNPSVPKLAAFAIREYVNRKLAEPGIRQNYESTWKPGSGLHVVRDGSG